MNEAKIASKKLDNESDVESKTARRAFSGLAIEDVSREQGIKNQGLDIEQLKKAAAQGKADAQYELGMCYQNGEGVGLDEEEAVRWYLAAATQGNARAQYSLALGYFNGSGVKKDEKEAIRWYCMAAQQGDEIAQITLF
jgi:TPR repeat protein